MSHAILPLPIEILQQALFDQVLELCESTRLLAAKIALDSLIVSLINHPNEFFSAKLLAHKVQVDEMLYREKESRELLAMGTIDDSWTAAGFIFGTQTHYKLTAEGTVIFRLEGESNDLPMFEQLAVIHEVDLFKDWIPFCFTSKKVVKLGPAEIIAYFGMSVPPVVTRDALIRAYGVDCLVEEGKILFIGSSIDDWPVDDSTSLSSTDSHTGQNINYDGTTIESDTSQTQTNKAVDLEKQPWKRPANWFHNRMVVKDFKSIVQILGPDTAKMVIVAQIDPKLPLPQPVINFIIKNVAGVFLYVLQRQVMKVHTNPDSNHGKRIRGNRAFYEDWLLPKIRQLCRERKWPQPIVSSLGISDTAQSGTGTGIGTQTVRGVRTVQADEIAACS